MCHKVKEMRLQKFLAHAGLASRRKAEEIIQLGQVKVNNKVVTELGSKVDPENDIIEVNNKVYNLESIKPVYIVLNKPRSVLSTVSDPQKRRTVIDIIRGEKERIYPVGRLDYLSEGLIVLTNDGEFANELMHPSSKIIKTYEVKVFGRVNHFLLKKLREGVKSQGDFLKPLSVNVLKLLQNKTWLEIKLHEGKNREIRRICDKLGLTIDKLRRVSIGGLTIDKMASGKYYYLSKDQMKKMIGMKEGPTPTAFVKKYKNHKLSKMKNVKNVANDDFFYRYKKKYYYQTLDNQKIQLEEKKRERQKVDRRQS